MTKKEFELLIEEFSNRRTAAIIRRDNPMGDGVESIINKNYLQGGIDAITTIIESLEARYKQLSQENHENHKPNHNED